MIQARNILSGFVEQYFNLVPHKSEFARVRNYQRDETGLLWLTDPVAKDSVVVQKLTQRNNRPVSGFSYISPNKVGRLGEPFVYDLALSRITGLDIFHDQDEKFLDRLKRELRDSSNTTKLLDVENANWKNDSELFKHLSDQFMAHRGEDYHVEIEVWKKGSGSPEKRHQESPIKSVPVLSPLVGNLVPQSI